MLNNNNKAHSLIRNPCLAIIVSIVCFILGEANFNLKGVYDMLEARMAQIERKIETLNKGKL